MLNSQSFLKVFVGLSWMAKASVQAALGPISLKYMKPDDPGIMFLMMCVSQSDQYPFLFSFHFKFTDRKYGEIVLMMCVLSIVLTAPLGAILISVTGTKLLTKTKPLTDPEGCYLYIFCSFFYY